jgi:plasmid rolling circle replication initiator protein Rep
LRTPLKNHKRVSREVEDGQKEKEKRRERERKKEMVRFFDLLESFGFGNLMIIMMHNNILNWFKTHSCKFFFFLSLHK